MNAFIFYEFEYKHVLFKLKSFEYERKIIKFFSERSENVLMLIYKCEFFYIIF